MRGTVIQVQSNGSLQLKHGLFYKYEVTIDSEGKEITGEYLSKSDNQNKFVQGQDCHFEHNIVNGFSKIKPINPEFANQSYSKASNNTSSTDKDALIARQSSLKCATDFVIANGGDITKVIHYADILSKYALTGDMPEEQKEHSEMPF